jgi:hypothetical protein
VGLPPYSDRLPRPFQEILDRGFGHTVTPISSTSE